MDGCDEANVITEDLIRECIKVSRKKLQLTTSNAFRKTCGTAITVLAGYVQAQV
jgi:hypothetical protein